MVEVQPLDSSILGSILLLQSTLHAAIGESHLSRMVARGLTALPGVARGGVCIEGRVDWSDRHEPESMTECPGRAVDAGNGCSGCTATCPVRQDAGKVFALKTNQYHYGAMLLSIEQDASTFTPYAPFIANTANLVALHIENTRNAEALMEANRTLEARVSARTNELRSEKQLLEGVLDSINDVIGVQLLDHTILRYNRAGYKLLGLSEEEVKGKKCYELIGRTTPCEICATSRAVASKKIETLEKFVPELGRHFLCASNPVLDEKGSIRLVIEQLTDITEKKTIDEKLQQAQKMEAVGSLAAGIAHDFNNLLFPIIGLSEMLLEDLPPGSPEHEYAQEIMNAGKRGGDLVKQILAFSRRTEHRMIPVRVQQVLKEVLKLCRSSIPAEIEITQNLQPDCGLVLADPTQVHQVAMNLITNAYHACEAAGGTIHVSVRQVDIGSDDLKSESLEPGPHVLLTVEDTACGIDPEALDKIFEPYFTTKEVGKGTGLGLTTVYGIVKEHQGDIKVDSEPGRGAVFTVYLPLMEPSADADAPAVPSGPVIGGSERILLVDDDEIVGRLEQQILDRLGYRTTVRTSSIEALGAFKAAPRAFDLVITDMSMPRLTGDRLAREMLAVRPDIPVIICTGFSERINPKKAKSMGLSGFLMKPVIGSELARIVRQVLDVARSKSGQGGQR